MTLNELKPVFKGIQNFQSFFASFLGSLQEFNGGIGINKTIVVEKHHDSRIHLRPKWGFLWEWGQFMTSLYLSRFDSSAGSRGQRRGRRLRVPVRLLGERARLQGLRLGHLRGNE